MAQITQQQGGIDQRLAAAEQRLARLDLQAQAAAGNAARAEGLLIAFATRRRLFRPIKPPTARAAHTSVPRAAFGRRERDFTVKGLKS